jgi:hypothetical protein
MINKKDFPVIVFHSRSIFPTGGIKRHLVLLYFLISLFLCESNNKKKKERFLDYEEYPPSFKLGSPKSCQFVIQNASSRPIWFSLRYFAIDWP